MMYIGAAMMCIGGAMIYIGAAMMCIGAAMMENIDAMQGNIAALSGDMTAAFGRIAQTPESHARIMGCIPEPLASVMHEPQLPHALPGVFSTRVGDAGWLRDNSQRSTSERRKGRVRPSVQSPIRQNS